MVRQIAIILILMLIDAGIRAEDIKNYSDCDVCPGSIHYGAAEAEEILGQDSLNRLSFLRFIEDKTVKLDLDGARQNGTAETDDKGYEIVIRNSANVIYIKHLTDGSYIQIESNFPPPQATGEPVRGYAEIYMQSQQSDIIELKDGLNIAWKKMKKSRIYEWLTSDNINADPKLSLKKKITYVFSVLEE